MNPIQYLKTLLPVFGKKDVADDLDALRTKLLDTTIPKYEKTTETFSGRYNFSSEYGKDFNLFFDKASKFNYKTNSVQGILDVMVNVLHTIPFFQRNIASFYNPSHANTQTGTNYLAAKTISLVKANLLQYLEMMNFAEEYSRRHLVVLVTAETNLNLGQPELNHIRPYELEYLKQNRDAYMKALNACAMPSSKIEAEFSKIPDVTVDETNESLLESTLGGENIDPFGFNFIPIRFNPIYHVRMMIADWQADRLHAAKEEAKYVEFKLLQLRRKLDGEPENTIIAKDVEYSKDRLNKLYTKIAEEEAKYA